MKTTISAGILLQVLGQKHQTVPESVAGGAHGPN